MGTRATPRWEEGRYLKPRRVIFLNGPPGSGKDTIGKMLSNQGYGELRSFKKRLIDIALLVSGVGAEAWHDRYENRELKETPWDALGGLSQREYLIRISEEWVKPTHGEDYFGKAALDSCWGHKDYVFTDSGFKDEIIPFLDSGFEVHIVRLHREGFNYTGDSRSYLSNVNGADCWDVTLVDGAPEMAVDIIKMAIC